MSLTCAGPSTLSTISPSSREAVDPIAELLSQLSGVRRAARPSSSQLHQLQMELQLQRQQAQAHRQTLDRLARRAPGPSTQPPAPAPGPAAQLTAAGQPAPPSSQTVAQPAGQGRADRKPETGFLLSNLETEESGPEDGTRESAKQRIFIQELLLSALNLEDSDPDDQS